MNTQTTPNALEVLLGLDTRDVHRALVAWHSDAANQGKTLEEAAEVGDEAAALWLKMEAELEPQVQRIWAELSTEDKIRTAVILQANQSRGNARLFFHLKEIAVNPALWTVNDPQEHCLRRAGFVFALVAVLVARLPVVLREDGPAVCDKWRKKAQPE